MYGGVRCEWSTVNLNPKYYLVLRTMSGANIHPYILQVLNDDEQRQRYDQFGEAGIGMGGGGGGSGFEVRTKAC